MKIQIRPRGSCPSCGSKYRTVSWKDDEGNRGRSTRGICPECDSSNPPAWYLDFFFGGKRLKIYSDDSGQVLDSYKRAERLGEKIKFQMEDGRFDPSQYIKAELNKYWTKSLMDQFGKAKEKEIAPSSIYNYRRMIKEAQGFFNIRDVRTIKKIDLINYKAHLENQFKFAPKTILNFVLHFKTFMNWCRTDAEVLTILPKFPEIDVPIPSPKWLDSPDQQRLFETVPENDKPIISFLMLHGCRPGEARALKCGDVDLRRQTITIKATFSARIYRERRKGRKARAVTIPIHPECLPYIEDRVKGNLPGAWLFVNGRTKDFYTENKLRRVWKQMKEKAGITGLRLYDATRHSFASQLVNRGVSLFVISRLMGHSNTKTTEKYSHESIEQGRINLQRLSLTKGATVHELAMVGNVAKKRE